MKPLSKHALIRAYRYLSYLGDKLMRSTAFFVLCSVGVFFLFGLIKTPLIAGSTVLSDMDCVVEPSVVVKLGTAVPGVLAVTRYDRSDYVSKGDVLASLDSSVERASLAIAEELASHATGISLRKVSAKFGDRTRTRNASLFESDTISQQNMDQVETETQIAHLQVKREQESKRLAELEVARARATLKRRSIISPIEGTVTTRYKSAGEYVDNEPVFEVAQLNPLHVEVIVPIENLGQIESGMKAGVELYVPGFENKELDAYVRRIDAVSDAASATFGVRLILDNPDLTIPSGVRCQVDIFAS